MKLTKLIYSQISVNNKSGVGFDSQMNKNELHDCHLNKREVFESASDSSVNEIEKENNKVNDRFKKVKGYHAVLPPYTRNYMPSRPDLSFARLDDSVDKTNVSETIASVPRNESTASKTSKDSLEQPKDVRPSAPIIEERVAGQKEVSPAWNNAQRGNHQNKLTHPHPKRNFIPTTIATKSGLVPVNAAKQSSPRAVASISTAKKYSLYLRGKKETAVKSSACWDLGDQQESKLTIISQDMDHTCLKDLTRSRIFYSRCSRHMTRNKSYLIDYQDIDGGFVAFAGSPKGGKLTGKGKIRTGKLDFKDLLDERSRFSWVFFLATKDETSGILKTFITGIENQIDHKVKIIRCDNGNEFKNNDLNQLCGMKGIKKEFSVARTPQQNRVAKRKKRSLIEAVRNMLADSLLPTTFWAEAVNTACYVQNRVLVTKPHNKTPYELLLDRPPTIIFIRPFGCPVTIQNTLDPLGKFDGKADDVRVLDTY
ncbi:putative ribonuclease H-like domain-containing protein [Tanacetum coccineum]|uniref:Ribonuclease H-like domain-containing protein n=1 Tax=Tanacetum coccineum TaxID=301880 RepID=A0ABQ4YE80_9ASTR